MIQSAAFAKDIELISPRVKDALEAVKAAGGLASQAMLRRYGFCNKR